MLEDKVEIQIELPEEAWTALEEARVDLGFDTVDELVSHIMEKELERYEVDNIDINLHDGR